MAGQIHWDNRELYSILTKLEYITNEVIRTLKNLVDILLFLLRVLNKEFFSKGVILLIIQYITKDDLDKIIINVFALRHEILFCDEI